jgi:hypothetical protein
MNWYEHDAVYNYHKIFINDENLKPHWIENPAQYTEFHCLKKSKNLFLNIGESWAYGEALPGIATGIQHYNFDSQLKNTFGSKIAKYLSCDFYQYAVPGNCNAFMYIELERILEYLNNNFDYDKIFLCAQLTEPSREEAALGVLPEGHPIQQMYHRKTKITFSDWLKTYDEIFLEIIWNIVKKYHNVEEIIWKNFCKWNTDKTYDLNILQENWITFSARKLKQEYTPISFQSIGWLDNIYKNRKQHKILFDSSWVSKEIESIEKSNLFIKGNELHNNHPTCAGHALWYENIIEYTGWKK